VPGVLGKKSEKAKNIKLESTRRVKLLRRVVEDEPLSFNVDRSTISRLKGLRRGSCRGLIDRGL
jgi:hypothetical protein